MRPFSYERAADVASAVATVAGRPGAAFLAGGTNLLDLAKLGVESPDTLVDVTRLPLRGVARLADGGIRIGALTRNSDVAADMIVRREFPVLAEALLNGASAQLRNMATVGGNLLQRTRCLYFEASWSTARRAGSSRRAGGLSVDRRDVACLSPARATPSARSSHRSRSTSTPVRCGSLACSACLPLAASSTRPLPNRS